MKGRGPRPRPPGLDVTAGLSPRQSLGWGLPHTREETSDSWLWRQPQNGLCPPYPLPTPFSTHSSSPLRPSCKLKKRKKSLLPFSDVISSRCSLPKNQKMKVGRDVSASICLDPGRPDPRPRQTPGASRPRQVKGSARLRAQLRPLAGLGCHQTSCPQNGRVAQGTCLTPLRGCETCRSFYRSGPSLPICRKGVVSASQGPCEESPGPPGVKRSRAVHTACPPQPPRSSRPVPSPAARAGRHARHIWAVNAARPPGPHSPLATDFGTAVPSPRPAVAVAPTAGRRSGEVVSLPGTGPVPVG